MSSDRPDALERNRLAALNALGILDTPPEPAFDRLAAAVRAVFDAPVALLGFLDGDRQWFKAKAGMEISESPRSISFCTHAIQQDGVMWVADARDDPRFSANPQVTGGLRLRFYAGAPVVGDDGERVGTLCVLGLEPRPFDPRLADLLAGFAQMASAELELRRHRRMRQVIGNLISTTSDAMVCADRDGRITLWNAAATAIFGWTRTEAIGQALDVIIPERFRAGHWGGFRKLIQGDEPSLVGKGSVEVPGLCKDGREIAIELTLSAWGSGEGQGVGAVIRDISERKAAEAELVHTRREAELAGRETAAAHDTVALLVRSVTTALVMTDAELRILDVSDRWAEQYGAAREAVIGRGMHDVFPSGRERWDPVYRRCLAGARERGESTSVVADDERTRWFRWEVAPWRDAGGQVAGLLLTNHDVSDLVHAKEAAELNERRLGLAMQIADLVVWEADVQTRALHVHGGDPTPLFGRAVTFADLARDGELIIHPDDKARAYAAWDAHLREGRPYRVEHRLPRADREVWVSSSVELVRDAEGRTRGLLGVLADITSRKSLEQDMQRAREAGEAAQRVKREFLANMSHEVRTPLNGVIGLAAALSYGKLAPEQAEMARMIQRSGEELEHMLTGVLDLVQLDAGRSEAAREDFDPLAVLTDAGARWSAAARRKGLRLQVARPEEIATGLGDPARVGRILDQLLDNAVKFTAQGSVRLSLEQQPTKTGAVRTVFTVRDTGVGFDTDGAERLFERFEQAEGGATRQFGGTGLGLALCRALAESLGGRIEARSRPGLGATFQLEFHLKPASCPEALVSAA